MGQKSEGTSRKYEKGREDRTTGDTDGRRGHKNMKMRQKEGSQKYENATKE
jgi:hypothetical protein